MLYIQENLHAVVDLPTALIELWALSKQLSVSINQEVVLKKIIAVLWEWQDVSNWLWWIWEEVFESLFHKLIMRVAEISPASPTERHHPLRQFNHELLWSYATAITLAMPNHHRRNPKDSELKLFWVLLSTCEKIEKNLPSHINN